jgi:hypothetical protein
MSLHLLPNTSLPCILPPLHPKHSSILFLASLHFPYSGLHSEPSILLLTFSVYFFITFLHLITHHLLRFIFLISLITGSLLVHNISSLALCLVKSFFLCSQWSPVSYPCLHSAASGSLTPRDITTIK